MKPFDSAEVHARLLALCRRAAGRGRASEAGQKLEAGDVRIDFGQHLAFRGDRRLELSPIGFEILAVLVDASPQVVRRSALERAIWGDDPPLGGTLRTHLYNLRTELHRGEPAILETVRGIGFRLHDGQLESASE